MTSRKRRRAVQVAVPALVVGILTFVALWRVGTPTDPGSADRPAVKPTPLPPVTTAAEVLLPTSVGRRASLDNARIVAMPSARTLWIAADAGRTFVVLDPDVKRSHEARVVEGGRVNLTGLVRRAPEASRIMRQWMVDADTARTVEQGGNYLHVTEVRPAT